MLDWLYNHWKLQNRPATTGGQS